MKFLINFLSKPIGAWLTPVVGSFVAYLFGLLLDKIPGASQFISPQVLAFLLFSLIMIVVNLLTVTQGFKYGKEVQVLLNIIGRQFNIQVKEDGVVGPVTALKAEKIADVLSVSTSHPASVRSGMQEARVTGRMA